jgi:hypothetical protein
VLHLLAFICESSAKLNAINKIGKWNSSRTGAAAYQSREKISPSREMLSLKNWGFEVSRQKEEQMK